VRYANQVMAGLAGSAVALAQLTDPGLRARLTERMRYLARYGQSPAGFFYEPTGMDVNYNFEVDGLVLRRAGATITIRWGSTRPAMLSTSTRTYLADATRRVHVLRIPHEGDIDVTITV
jgi:hypothetical protein